MKVCLILTILLILLIPLVYAAEIPECQRTHLSSDLPCSVISSVKPADGCEKQVSIFFGNGTSVANHTYQDYIPTCRFIWNITTPNTYAYNSSIDDGVITINREDNMLSIILLQIFIIAFFVAIGLPHKVGFVKLTTWGLALIEFLMSIWLVYLNQVGGDIDALLYINAIGMLLVGGFFGVFTLIIMLLKLSRVEKNEDLEDDGYTKFAFPK